MRSTLVSLAITLISSSAALPARAQNLKVMTFNIFYGGDDLDMETGGFCAEPDSCQATFEQVKATILASGADIVGLQEPERNTARLGRELGWYASERHHLISRFPIIDPPESEGLFAYVEIQAGKVVAVSNVHLPSDPYGPYLVRDGGSADALMQLEVQARLPDAEKPIEAIKRLIQKKIPVFLTGDFNSPSHLDWTEAVTQVRPEVKFPFVWPAAFALAASGLRDSYREAHPDPVLNPGFTWTPGGPESDPHEVFDRIDWVLTGGPSQTLSSRIVGEAGGPGVDISMKPYPSDHRAVVSTFSVQAAKTPVLVAVSNRRVVIGETLELTYHGKGSDQEFLALAKTPSKGQSLGEIIVSKPTGGRGVTDGRIVFDTKALKPGSYEALLVKGHDKVLSRTPFWVYTRGDKTSLKVDSSSFSVGSPIAAEVHNATGRRLDWVGVYRCDDEGCGASGDFLFYTYIDAAIEGRVQVGPNVREGSESWPLAPGRYILRLLTDDSYETIATSQAFTIEK